MEYKDMSFQSLRKECAKRGIKFDVKDKTEVLIEKLKSFDKDKENRIDTVKKTRNKRLTPVRCKVIPNNPEEEKDSEMVIIINEAMTWRQPVPFNVEITIPEFVVKNLEDRKYQHFIKTKTKLGTFDKSIMEKAYTIVRL